MVKNTEFGAIIGLSSLPPFILNEGDEKLEFDNMASSQAMEEQVEKLIRMFNKVAESNSEAFHKRFLPIFDELIKAKVIKDE